MNKVRLFIFLLVAAGFTACKKSADTNNIPPPGGNQATSLTYGDSILYIKDGVEDNIVLPITDLQGSYYGFPDGIELDEMTGAINVDKSESGLRYRISFVPQGRNDTISTIVLLSGINYLDNIYYLDEHDTTATAVYNGSMDNTIPGSDGSSVFDDGGGCNGQGVAVNILNGSINIAQTVRNGVLGDVPSNGSQKEVELLYRLSDDSKKAQNRLKVKLYYFDTPEDITQDLVQLMRERKGMFIGQDPQPPSFGYYRPQGNGVIISNSVTGIAKPRPPCIFVVGTRVKR
jgi:hypothetical protein